MRIQLTRLRENMKHEIAELYAQVFEAPPWDEYMKCPVCKVHYSKEEATRRSDGDLCKNCGHHAKLVPFWREGPALNVFEDAIRRRNFVGFGACDADQNRKLVGFSWGFPVPTQATPEVDFPEVNRRLRMYGHDPASLFYCAETGVHPTLWGRKIGTSVSYTRIREVRNKGFKGVVFRTINPKMVSLFELFFGQGKVQSMFEDPDKLKEDRLWYFCDSTDLRTQRIDVPFVPWWVEMLNALG